MIAQYIRPASKMMARILLVLVLIAGCHDRRARAWLAKWEAARACILGTPEYEPDSATSVAAAALEHRLDRCWPQLDEVRDDAERALAHLDDWDALRGDLEALRATLDDAPVIDRIDARLHRAGLSAKRSAREPAPPALPSGQTIIINGAPLTATARVRIKGGRIVAELERGDVSVHADIYAPSSMHTTIVPRGYVLAYPSQTWAAKADESRLTVAEVGDPKKSRSVTLPGSFAVVRAMDWRPTRAVVLRSLDAASTVAVAISHDDGQTWTAYRDPGARSLDYTIQDPLTGVVDVITNGTVVSYIYRISAVWPWRFPKAVQFSRFSVVDDCSYGDTAWAYDNVSVHRLTPPVPDTYSPVGLAWDMSDCGTSSALVLVHDEHDILERCRGDGCEHVHVASHTVRGVAALLDDERWIYAAATHGLVAIWRESTDGERELYRLPQGATLAGLVTLHGTPHLVTILDRVYQLVPLPASPEPRRSTPDR